jgi:hypothetical protein
MFKLDLLENALDFIASGINEVFNDKDTFAYVRPDERTYRAYKYGTLHLFSGFLLLVKLRLERHHALALYSGKLRDAEEKIKKGKLPNTVDFDEALEKLELGPKVTFSKNQIDTIHAMRDFRNNFEHFKFQVNPFHAWAVISNFLIIIDEFMVKELKVKMEETKEFRAIHEKIDNIKQVRVRAFEKRKDAWTKEMLKKSKVFEKNKEDILASLEVSERDIKHGAEPAVFLECGFCGKESVVTSGEYAGICAECFEFGHLHECERCHEVSLGEYHEKYDVEFCKDCIKEMMKD